MTGTTLTTQLRDPAQTGQHMPAIKRRDHRSMAIMPQSYSELQNYASDVLKSGMLPPHFKNGTQVAIAMAYGLEIGLTPMIAIQYICVINNRPLVWGDGLMAITMASGLVEDISETWDEVTKTARCTVKRIGQASPAIHEFSMDSARRAQLDKKDTYVKYPQRMCQWRARTYAIRDKFPDVMAGLTSVDEYIDTNPGKVNLVMTPSGEMTVDEPDENKLTDTAPQNVDGSVGHRYAHRLEECITTDQINAIGLEFADEVEHSCSPEEIIELKELRRLHKLRVIGKMDADEVMAMSRNFHDDAIEDAVVIEVDDETGADNTSEAAQPETEITTEAD